MRVPSTPICRRKYHGKVRLDLSITIFLFGLIVLLSACTNPLAGPTVSQGDTSPVPTLGGLSTPTINVSPSPKLTPTVISLQIVGCPATLSNNWDKLVGTQTGVNKVQKVMCGSLEGAGSLVALVDVRYYTSDARLDIYAYDNLGGTPRQTFSLKGLLDGDALISSQSTITTAEIGARDSVRTFPDVFREYQWNGSSFGQVFFPWLYPDMTRYQAEKDQALVVAGADPWKLSGSEVSAHLAQSVFHWNNITTNVLLNSQRTNTVEITINNTATGGGGFIATLHHLDGIATNIYEVEKVTSINSNASLTNPVAGSRLSSPVSIGGSFVVNSNTLGQVQILDASYFSVGNSGIIHSPTTSGFTAFSVSISFSLKSQGAEDGVLLFLPTSQSNIYLSNQAIMFKVILSG